MWKERASKVDGTKEIGVQLPKKSLMGVSVSDYWALSVADWYG